MFQSLAPWFVINEKYKPKNQKYIYKVRGVK